MKVLYAQYNSHDKSSIDTAIELDDGMTIPYCYSSNNDGTVIDKFIEKELYDDLLHPIEYDGPSEYETIVSRIRHRRDKLLKDTDFFVSIPDYPITDHDRECVKQYRQLLRDITKQDGFPYNIIWPELPDLLKDKIV